jgi:hypothetical protein
MDVLHTFQKGIVQDFVKLTLHIIELFSKNEPYLGNFIKVFFLYFLKFH